MTIPEALKELYVALGGDADDVANMSTNPELIAKIATIAGGGGLPEVTAEDNGDVLTVVDGEWAKSAKDHVIIYGTCDSNETVVTLDNGVTKKDIYNLILDGVDVAILLHSSSSTSFRGRLYFNGIVGTNYSFGSFYGGGGKLNYVMYSVDNSAGKTLSPSVWRFTPDA